MRWKFTFGMILLSTSAMILVTSPAWMRLVGLDGVQHLVGQALDQRVGRFVGRVSQGARAHDRGQASRAAASAAQKTSFHAHSFRSEASPAHPPIGTSAPGAGSEAGSSLCNSHAD